MASGDVEAVIVCPSNPYVSIDPILSLPGVRHWLLRTPAPMVAVSPIIGGAAVKGPAAKMMQELGVQPGGGAVAGFYGELLDGLVIDSGDAAEAQGLACATLTTPTLMSSAEDRARLASEVLAWARGLAPGARG
jgi:LPPG:FO 2-phospho-L-lactate transferase